MHSEPAQWKNLTYSPDIRDQVEEPNIWWCLTPALSHYSMCCLYESIILHAKVWKSQDCQLSRLQMLMIW